MQHELCLIQQRGEDEVLPSLAENLGCALGCLEGPTKGRFRTARLL